MKSASVGTLKYAPDTALEFPVIVPSSYPLTGVSAFFEIRHPTGVIYSLEDNGVDISFTSQTMNVNIQPTTTGDSGGLTFAAAVAAEAEIGFNLDLHQSGSSVVDYRIQGCLLNLPTHGKF